jgi:hypothetical protein
MYEALVEQPAEKVLWMEMIPLNAVYLQGLFTSHYGGLQVIREWFNGLSRPFHACRRKVNKVNLHGKETTTSEEESIKFPFQRTGYICLENELDFF